MYIQGKGVPQDFVRAYMWLNLSAARGDENGKKGRDIFMSLMTPAQLAEAQRLSSEWENAFEHRQGKK